VKGEKVERFEPGKIYVVEFWATWCGSCRAGIPHLTELSQHYKDRGVRFISVDIWEQDRKLVRPFVDKMGSRLDYSVAVDDVPEEADPTEGAMAKNWMKAAEENAIPTAFVVRDERISWIGHPMQMDEALARIVDGDWDARLRAKDRLTAKSRERKAVPVQAKVFKPFRAGDYKATLAAIEEVTSGDPDLVEVFAWVKFAATCNGGDADRGLALGSKLLESNFDEPQVLNNTFSYVIDPELKRDPDPRVAHLALRAVRRAVELTKEQDDKILDTLALALFRTGDFAGAAEAQERVLKRVELREPDRTGPDYKLHNERVAKYRKAQAEKAGGR
jgi:thiol-disulfide isomerase/thioredoxin